MVRQDDSVLEPGSRLGRYELVDVIAVGGMGEIYRAIDPHLSREVAVKTLRPSQQHSESRRRLLIREAKIIANLSHRHICTLHDVGKQGDIDYLVLEYLEGTPLDQRLAAGRLPVRLILRLGWQIASALAEAHRHGVVHRDLKPSNIMLTGSGAMVEARLLDFGVSRWRETGESSPSPELAETLTLEGKLFGTTAYMSPEQTEGSAVDGRSDLFSFGAVLYEMVAGVRAFDGANHARLFARILDHEPARLESLREDAPRHLIHVIDRCLAKAPEDRWQSASDVMQELRWARRRWNDESSADSAAPSLPVTDSEQESEAFPDPKTPAAPLHPTNRLVEGPWLLGMSFAGSAAAMYLTNPSVHDALLYPLLAVIGASPLVLLFAAVRGFDTREAARELSRSLGSIGSLMPGALPGKRRSLGIAFGLFLGTVLAMVLGHLANNLMPHLTFLPHGSSETTEWALLDPNDDWRTYRSRYKASYLENSGVKEKGWQAHKHELGRGSVRSARTLFSFSLLLGIAGLVDLVRRRRHRGVASLLVSCLACLVLYFFWYDREGHYVREMVMSASRLPPELRPELPSTAPQLLHRYLVGSP